MLVPSDIGSISNRRRLRLQRRNGERSLELYFAAYHARRSQMPSRPISLPLPPWLRHFLSSWRWANSPLNMERHDGFKSEAAEGVATGGETGKKAP